MGNSSYGPRRGGRRRHGLLGAAVLVGLLGSGGFIWQGTTAAFTASTNNGTNSWTAGSIALADDDSAVAMFAPTNLKPGDTGTKCINVTFTGTLTSAIKLYASASTDPDTVAQYIDLTVEEGSGGTFGSCASFVSGSTLFSGTLATFVSTKGSYANGVSSWAPSANGSKSYRFVYTLNASTPDTKQGKTTTATFTWEARTT